MTTFDDHKNLAYSTIATAPSPASSGLSLVVASGDGSLFPAVPFNALVWPSGAQPNVSNAELIRVTAIATDTFTITRATESTVARTIVVGDQIANIPSDKVFTDIEGAITSLEGLQGQILTVPTTDVTVGVNCSAVVVEEYVMDATHELIFSDPSEMAVI